MSNISPDEKEWKPGEWPVVGHRWAVELLSGAIASGNVRHAYLFTGPQSIGKTALALAFAQALLCEREERPCGQCPPCRKVLAGVHPDLRLVAPGYGADAEKAEKSEAKSLGIDVVRFLRGEAALTPFEGNWKIFLIPEAENMTPESQNALLKTLEEPPPQVVILLTALREESLFPTIVSRCQIFNLRPLPALEISEALQKRWGVAEKRAEVLANLSRGTIGWAMNALGEETILEDRQKKLEELIELPDAGLVERMNIAATWAQKPEEAVALLELWLGWWRDLLAVRAEDKAGAQNLDRHRDLEKQAARYSVTQIAGFLSALERTLGYIERNANLRLALEVLMLDLPSPA
ncbi:MAG: DNA polymerase III subunit delta' [Chloroflexi bacterium]|nr:DNA polymerase III subunit delta' [Chloroflexota bacterium]